jgi:hypothetical protein
MAKETKQNGASIKSITEDNVEEQIRNANTFSKEVVELAKKNKEKDDAERQAREYARIADKAAYTNLMLKIRAKYNKETAEITKDVSKKSLDLLEKVEAGELTAIEYDDELTKIVDDGIKEVDKARKALDKNMQELRNKFPNNWSYNWDNPYSRLNRAIEKA